MKHLKLFIVLLAFNCTAQIDVGTHLSPYGFYGGVEAIYPIKTKWIVGGEFGYNLINPDINFKYGLTTGWRITEMFSVELDASKLSGPHPMYDEDFEIALGTKITPPESWLMFSFQATYPLFVKLGVGIRLDYLRLFKYNRRFYYYRYPWVSKEFRPKYAPKGF